MSIVNFFFKIQPMKRHRLFPNAKGKKQVTLFKRESSYYARYSVQNITVSNGNRYVTESLKTLDYALATERAWERLAAIRVAEKSGVAVRSETVSSVIAEFLTAYQDALELGMSNFTPSMLRG